VSASRLLHGLVAACVALACALWLARALRGAPFGLLLPAGAACLLVLAWLVAPRPWGGGTPWRRLFAPDPRRRAGPGCLMAVFWWLGASLLALVALGAAYGFDLDATGWRPATPAELARHAAFGLAVSVLHGAFCLGWAMRADLAEDRDFAAAARATVLGAALALVAGVLAGAPWQATALLVGLVAPATLVMAVVVLLGGRTWPVMVANVAAWTVPMLAIEVPTYAY
jgi:hypothetical protein